MRVEAQFDQSLVQKYNRSGPRYTSYPTALEFHPGFGEVDYRRAAELSNATGKPLSLYFHIPFCDTLCYYCGCNKIITHNETRKENYVQTLVQEIALHGPLSDRSRVVQQLHWGGGTPTSISHDAMRRIIGAAREHFHMLEDDQGEYSVEVDPRGVSAETVQVLRSLGFNRMSLGVQDFEPEVQRAVNRLQSVEETRSVIEAARACGFRSINVDLIYGLPLQTRVSFARTLDVVLQLKPDRLAIFNYAHLPARFKSQKLIDTTQLPPPEIKLAMVEDTNRRLAEAGYLLVGMDHYALADDELVQAQIAGTLYRNFQGYSTHADCDMVGMGVTAISMVGRSYSQNSKDTKHYSEAVRAGQIPIHAGYELTEDDIIRREVITQIMCNFELNFARMGQRLGLNFSDYFAADLPRLQELAADGIVELTATDLRVLPRGVPLIRHVAMALDAHLHKQDSTRYSKVI